MLGGSTMNRMLTLAVVVFSFGTAQASTLIPSRPSLNSSFRGESVSASLLVEYFSELPEPNEGETNKQWVDRLGSGLARFKKLVKAGYSEATLRRLTDHHSVAVRRAAVLALHFTGTMASNETIVACLRDEDAQIRLMAADALPALWLRADSEPNNTALQKALQQTDPKKAISSLTALIRNSPQFAEAYNQRGLLYFQIGEYERCAADYQKTLELNPQHFTAAAGMGRCYLRLRLPSPALKAFRTAFKINPNLDGIDDAIRDLENVVGEGDK
jgi:tetratricopeptide (TPR) repeat protein